MVDRRYKRDYQPAKALPGARPGHPSSIDAAKDSFRADELIDGIGTCLNDGFLACFWDLRDNLLRGCEDESRYASRGDVVSRDAKRRLQP